MSLGILVPLIFISMIVNCDVNYSKDIGILARLDLINSLKIALTLAKPRATREERKAAVEFVKFLCHPRSDEFIEAFYATSQINNTNGFHQFLNGILFNANPALPVWNATYLIKKMLDTKTNYTAVEAIRGMTKTRKSTKLTYTSEKNWNISRHTAKGKPVTFLTKMRLREIESPHQARKKIDYIKIYNKPELTELHTLLTFVTENVHERR